MNAHEEKSKSEGAFAFKVVTNLSAIATAPACPVERGAIERPVEGRLVKGYSLLSIMGLGYSVCNTWAATAATLGAYLVQGGPVMLIYGFMVMAIIAFCVAASLAELASVFPTAGGQYHWAMILAPKVYQRQIGLATGFVSCAAWIFITASACLLCSQYIIALVVYNYPDFTPYPWHYFVIYQAINALTTSYNWCLVHKSPWIFQVSVVVSLATAFATFFAMLCGPGTVKSHASSAFVWTGFKNGVGWSSNAMVVLTGMLNANFGYSGLDGAIHLAEDSLDPRRDVPKALFSTVLIGLVVNVPWVLAALYATKDLDAILASPTGSPALEILDQALGNKGAVTFFTVFLLLNVLFAAIGCSQAAGRLTWSFASDKGLFGAKYLSRLNHKYNSSGGSLVLNSAWIFVIGCLYLGSSTTYNAIIGSTMILYHISYAIPVALLMLNGRRLPTRAWVPLGRFGWLANAVTVFWGVYALVIYCIPPTMPVTPTSMNYAVVVMAVLLCYALLNWFGYAKKRFTMPRLEGLDDGSEEGSELAPM